MHPSLQSFLPSAASRRLALRLALPAVLLSPSLFAVNYTYTATNTVGDVWSAGTNWDAAPLSASTAALILNATSLGNSVANSSNNDIAGDFVTNSLTLNGSRAGTGNANTSASVTLTGNALEFQTNGATTPVINLNANSGSHKPVSTNYTDALIYTVNNNLVLTNTTTFQGTGTATFNFNGVIGGAGGLTKSGASLLYLGNTANTYAGVTTLSGGTVFTGNLANGGGASGIGASSNAAANLVFNGGLLGYNGSTAITPDRDYTLNTTGGGWDASGSTTAATLTVNTALAFSGTGTRTLTLAGTNTGDNTFGTLLANQGANATSLLKVGAGTWVLTGANTYTGSTTVGRYINGASGANGGTLKLSGSGKIGTGALTVFSGTLDLNGTSQTAASLTMGTGTSTPYDPANSNVLLGAGGELKLGGNIAFSSQWSAFDGFITGGNLTLTGNRTINVDDRTLTISSVIRDDGTSRSITKGSVARTGTLVLTGASTYTGATTITGGTLKIGGADDRLPTGTTLTVNGGSTTLARGTFDLNGLNQSVAGLAGGSGTNRGIVTNNATGTGTSTITVSGTSTFSGIIQNGATAKVALTKSTGGTLTLAGSNTYTGNTSITGGTLALGAAGSINNSAVIAVESGATFDVSAVAGGYVLGSAGAQTLRGAGGVAGAVTMVAGSTVAAGSNGATLGTLTFGGSLTSASGAVFSLKLNSDTALSDAIIASGITLNGATLALTDLGSATLSMPTTFTLFHSTSSSVAGTFSGLAEGASVMVGANSYTISYLANGGTDITLSAGAIPEPSTYAMIGGALVLTAAACRRRRSS